MRVMQIPRKICYLLCLWSAITANWDLKHIRFKIISYIMKYYLPNKNIDIETSRYSSATLKRKTKYINILQWNYLK